MWYVADLFIRARNAAVYAGLRMNKNGGGYENRSGYASSHKKRPSKSVLEVYLQYTLIEWG
jgi:hypothetical protein